MPCPKKEAFLAFAAVQKDRCNESEPCAQFPNCSELVSMFCANCGSTTPDCEPCFDLDDVIGGTYATNHAKRMLNLPPKTSSLEIRDAVLASIRSRHENN